MSGGKHSAAFELPFEEWEALNEIAKREEKSKSEILRELVRRKINEHGIKPVKRKRKSTA